jgi:hypothetical protein
MDYLPARSCARFEDSSNGREEWKECLTNRLPARSCAGFEDSSTGREEWKECVTNGLHGGSCAGLKIPPLEGRNGRSV